jgi:hypothetical protein
MRFSVGVYLSKVASEADRWYSNSDVYVTNCWNGWSRGMSAFHNETIGTAGWHDVQ